MTKKEHETNIAATLYESIEDETPGQIENREKRELGFSLPNLALGLDITVKIALLVTFLVGYLEYRASVRERELKASFEIISDWEEGGFQEAMESLSYHIDIFRKGFRDQMPQEVSNAILEHSFVTNRMLQKADSDRDFDLKIRKVFYFYNKLGICTEGKICNKQIITGFFHDSGVDFLYYFFPYAQLRRTTGQPTFGYLAEEFVKAE